MSVPESLATLRLWQLISPTLPVGAYAYSAGLEAAVDQGLVAGEADLVEWTEGQIRHSLTGLDVPALCRLFKAWEGNDAPAVRRWTDFLLACRETAELRSEDIHLGRALARLLPELIGDDTRAWDQNGDITWATLFARAAVAWEIPLHSAAEGYLWAWLENQVAAGVKLIPLGQTAGQRVLARVSVCIPEAVTAGMDVEDDDIGYGAPGVALLSAMHETQYSRLFRS
jgi:urease accessory protein